MPYRLIFDLSNQRGVSRLDLTECDPFPRCLPFDRRQKGPIVKRVRHLVEFSAHIPVMDEPQIFHDES